MTRELFWLTLTVILTGLLWVPYVLNRIMVRGVTGAMANPSRNDKPLADWANRLLFAHDNAVENLIVFAPLVLILNAADVSTPTTVLACAVYFWSRVVHLVVYTLGLPIFRTLAFLVGFFAQAVLAVAILRIPV
ncbi:MAPEG family protein [Tardiphaga sp. 813_E8_N1_3]|uniref:MAPEG family protein n=1 Tax=Tardiphaga sp. 813_E8_N1_3 TaxID=3240760 RepID=UPI003F1F02D1